MQNRVQGRGEGGLSGVSISIFFHSLSLSAIPFFLSVFRPLCVCPYHGVVCEGGGGDASRGLEQRQGTTTILVTRTETQQTSVGIARLSPTEDGMTGRQSSPCRVDRPALSPACDSPSPCRVWMLLPRFQRCDVCVPRRCCCVDVPGLLFLRFIYHF